ncbi:hypothetical protein FHW16_003444 [Phyllobacterium myrsinacearum]|uniref:Uncharacterized protein n=1 Tax=Phyllobacterium myrsinacearum TaxID=28101 RepID=A0A839ENF3_9HYPH|nr:hypothetical protein [Phyllobacterium myrsinacearum]
MKKARPLPNYFMDGADAVSQETSCDSLSVSGLVVTPEVIQHHRLYAHEMRNIAMRTTIAAVTRAFRRLFKTANLTNQ